MLGGSTKSASGYSAPEINKINDIIVTLTILWFTDIK